MATKKKKKKPNPQSVLILKQRRGIATPEELDQLYPWEVPLSESWPDDPGMTRYVRVEDTRFRGHRLHIHGRIRVGIHFDHSIGVEEAHTPHHLFEMSSNKGPVYFISHRKEPCSAREHHSWVVNAWQNKEVPGAFHPMRKDDLRCWDGLIVHGIKADLSHQPGYVGRITPARFVAAFLDWRWCDPGTRSVIRPEADDGWEFDGEGGNWM